MYKFMLCFAVCLLVFNVTAEMRVWTSIKGDTIEAEFISVFAGKAVLRCANGKELKVPLSGLCAVDIKYLNESIPPEIDIEVDVDNDKKSLESYSSDYGSYDYSKKAQKIKCKVTMSKKSKQANSTPLKAFIYVFSEDAKMDEMEVILKEEHEFSFKHQDSAVFSTGTASLTITKSSSNYGYGSNSGAEYEGYVVYVEDGKGRVMAVRGSRKFYEENLNKIKPAIPGTRFDDDMDMINPPSEGGSKKKRNKRQ